MPNLPELLREGRESKGMKQADVAAMMNVSDSLISFFETGQIMPDREKLIRLAEIYGLDLSNLLPMYMDPEDRAKNRQEREWLRAWRNRDAKKASTMMQKHFLQM